MTAALDKLYTCIEIETFVVSVTVQDTDRQPAMAEADVTLQLLKLFNYESPVVNVIAMY
jgi:hypothetical protein